jgi:hypothetical protein
MEAEANLINDRIAPAASKKFACLFLYHPSVLLYYQQHPLISKNGNLVDKPEANYEQESPDFE